MLITTKLKVVCYWLISILFLNLSTNQRDSTHVCTCKPFTVGTYTPENTHTPHTITQSWLSFCYGLGVLKIVCPSIQAPNQQCSIWSIHGSNTESRFRILSSFFLRVAAAARNENPRGFHVDMQREFRWCRKGNIEPILSENTHDTSSVVRM